MSEITPEKVAAAACEGISGWRHSLESSLSLTAEGNVLSLAAVRWDGPGDTEVVHHFRAVVVEGETGPIVLDRPASLDREWREDDDLRSWVSPDYFVCVQPHAMSVAYLTPQQARKEAARLAALADEAQRLAGEEIARNRAEAAQAEQERAK